LSDGDSTTPAALEKEIAAILHYLLRAAYAHLTVQERAEAVYGVGWTLSKDVEKFNSEARELKANTKPTPTDFSDKVKILKPYAQKTKPFERELNQRVTKAPENPSLSFFTSVLYLICGRWLWHRYLHSRFGLSQLDLNKLPSARYEQLLYETAIDRLTMLQVQFDSYRRVLLDLLATIEERASYVQFEEFFAEVCHTVGINCIRDFQQNFTEQKMRLKQARGASGEVEWAYLVAWVEANLSFSPEHNPRLAKAVEIEGQQTVLNDIPGAIAEALTADDRALNEPFSSGTGETSVLSRISGHLEVKNKELPLKAEHEDITDAGANDFTLHEEARDAIARVIQRADLTPIQREVFLLDLQDLTAKEIAERKGKAVGTIKKTLFEAKKKVERALN
jgi:Sigma-70, region 4